jgi:hypothetical protein
MSSSQRLNVCPRCSGPNETVRGDDELDESPVPDRVHALALDIKHRLRAVCAHMPDDELLRLATTVAAAELRHFSPTAARRHPRRSAHR